MKGVTQEKLIRMIKAGQQIIFLYKKKNPIQSEPGFFVGVRTIRINRINHLF